VVCIKPDVAIVGIECGSNNVYTITVWCILLAVISLHHLEIYEDARESIHHCLKKRPYQTTVIFG